MSKKIINVPLLIKGCRERNRSSQLGLYEHFYAYGISVCLRYCSNREEALEVLNDGFLKVFTKIDLYNPAYSFKSWIRKILINAAIDHHRKYCKISRFDPLDSSGENKIYTHNLGLENLIYEDLLKVMQQLSPAYRLVFNLFVVDGLSHKEIAKKLNIGEGTSKSNLAKAKRKIKLILKTSHGIFYKPASYGRTQYRPSI